MFNFLLMTASFDIWWVSILIHVFNLAILVFFLWLLLHKPIKKFIKKRQEQIANTIEETNAASEDVLSKQQEYDGLINQAKQEVAKASEIAKTNVDIQKKQILDSAHKEADEIISIAKSEAKKERKKIEISIKEDIAEISTGIASKILSREINQKDNKKIINDCLKSWNENE